MDTAKLRNPHLLAMIPQAGGGAYRVAGLCPGVLIHPRGYDLYIQFLAGSGKKIVPIVLVQAESTGIGRSVGNRRLPAQALVVRSKGLFDEQRNQTKWSCFQTSAACGPLHDSKHLSKGVHPP